MPTSLRACALFAFLIALAAPASAQVWGEIAGRVTIAGSGEGLPGATVLVEGTSFGSAAATDGTYRFRIPEGTYPLRVSAIGFATVRDTLVVLRGQTRRFDVALAEATIEGGTVVAEGQAERGVGVSAIDPRDVRQMPLPLADVMRGVQTELGVASNNELSNAYSVRGGSYEENQFFVDGFEVYRPLRISQGEQEGLGLINGDLADRLTLFAGGFPVRYGGKLASVLDVTYAQPEGVLRGTAYSSLLDAGAAVQGGLGRGMGLAVAARSARPQRFFGSQELKGGYDPDFRDVQGLFDWTLSPNHSLRVLGLYARHRFRLSPRSRETTFGIYPNDVQTVAIDFSGAETDGYDVGLAGVRLASQFSPTVRAEHRLSVFSTREFETYDVTSRSSLFRRPRRPDGPPTELDRILEGQTLQAETADNRITQTVATAEGRYLFGGGAHGFDAGWQVRQLQFDDRLFERTTISGRDAAGEAVDVVAALLDDTGGLSATQGALWFEDAITRGRLALTPGLRADYFSYNSELTVSPRLNLVFRSSPTLAWLAGAGVYHQAPTYRELRGEPAPGETINAQLDGDIASQRALQAVLGVERFFTGRRIQFRGELYAKRLTNLISYDVENVRVAYSGENDSEGYAAGLDMQLRGELVPGLPSWINYGFLVARERFFAPEVADFPDADDYQQALDRFARRGGGSYVPRPTDRRHNVTIYVQDYVPGDDTWSLHIRTLYSTGVPVTAPSAETEINGVSIFQPGPRSGVRLPSYFRFDMGATKSVRVGMSPTGAPLALLATVEVLNVFDQTNTIAYSWQEQTSLDPGSGRAIRQFLAVPTRLTPRTLNVRVRLDF